MRLAFALALLTATGTLAGDHEVYQVAGKLAVLETVSLPDSQGTAVRHATRFMMVLDTDRTLDYGKAAGSEFKPLFDEIMASSRRNVRPGYRDAEGSRLALRRTPGTLGALLEKTIPGGDRLGFFDFTGKLALHQDVGHIWARASTHHVLGELCIETAAHDGEGWARPEGGCDFLLGPQEFDQSAHTRRPGFRIPGDHERKAGGKLLLDVVRE